MNVLVIGGNGFFGRKLVTTLLNDPQVSKVVSMDQSEPRGYFLKSIEDHASKFAFARGDISQIEDILTVMKESTIDRAVNFAYLMARETEKMPRLNAKINVLGMCNVFEAARLMGVGRVVYTSSCGVYGPQSDYGDREVTELDIPRPLIPYGMSKQLNEIAANQYAEQYGMSVIGLRPSHGFGHGRAAAGVSKRFSAIVTLPATGQPVTIEVKAASEYSVITPDDVASFTVTLLKAPSPKYRVYNVAGPTVTLEQIASQVRRYLPDARIEFGEGSGDLKVAQRISVARAKEEFGFVPMPLARAVLTHINNARLEAGLKPLKG